MQPIIRSEKLSQVHSDIRGPVYVEAMKMIAEEPRPAPQYRQSCHLRLYHAPSVRHALLENADKAVGYCDFRGMPAARQAILEYETGKGIQGLTLDDIFVGNGVSEMAQFAITTLLNYGDEILLPVPATPCGPMSPSSPGPSRCSTPAMKPPTGTPMSRTFAGRSPPVPVPSSSSIPITPLARCTPRTAGADCGDRPGKGTYPPLG